MWSARMIGVSGRLERSSLTALVRVSLSISASMEHEFGMASIIYASASMSAMRSMTSLSRKALPENPRFMNS